MASTSDTLNLGSIKLQRDLPVAETQRARGEDPIIHPEAAAAARARIAALAEHHPVAQPTKVPSVPTASIITDKTRLKSEEFHQPLPHGRKIPSALVPFLTAAGIFCLVLLLFKAPIIINQFQYTFASHPKATPTAPAAASEIIPAANTITIPKISVQAPVNYEPSIQEAAIQKALESGVVHYGNTPAPGQPGNVAIFGHSSNDWWEPGNFKFVFVLLDKLSPGDQITIDYNSHRYVYEVTGSKIVEPTDVAVLSPTSTPTLTLITCSPPGTSLRRLVVTAKQVSPDPSTVAVSAPTPAATSLTSLTSSSPSFLQQIGSVWNGIVSGISSLFGAGSSNNANTPGQLPASK
ncbi:MAG TPA: class D sortase [Candidatus Saccharimonadia bacterium]|jgi:sortase A|nr:class D sortase [Candidatus Saccharimonadia bacterium]